MTVSITAFSCWFPGHNTIRPSGKIISRTTQPASFDNVSVSNGFELILTQDSICNLRIETYENLYEYIKVEIVDSTLQIYIKDGFRFFGCPKVKIYLSCNSLNDISCSGGGRINMENGWSGDKMNISISGGGRATGKLQMNTLEMDLSGGSRVGLDGKTEYLTISASGGSACDGESLESDICRISVSGGSRADLKINKNLEVEASGGSRVNYTGNPEVSSQVSGGSRIEKR